VEQALARCKAATSDSQEMPDELVFQCWQRLPTRMLPETEPGTMTYLVKHWIDTHH
jgi:hypothetical protein